MQSPEWQAQMKQHKSYWFAVGAGGAFQLDSIPPGTCALNLEARKGGDRGFGGRAVVSSKTVVTVPDSADPSNPIYVGEILLSTEQ